MKITWEDLKNKKIAIHTPTEDVMRFVINAGVTILNSRDYLYEDCDDGKTFYNCKEETCVRFYGNGSWGYSHKRFYEDEGFEIVEYEEVKHLFEDYIDTIKTEETKYLAKVKLKNGEEGYFREEWDQGGHWLSPVEEIKYADTYTNLTALKEILDIYKEEIEEYKIIKRTTVSSETFEFME